MQIYNYGKIFYKNLLIFLKIIKMKNSILLVITLPTGLELILTDYIIDKSWKS